MAVPRSDRQEHCLRPLEAHAEPREELIRRRVVRHEESLAIECQREVAVTHLESDAQRLLARGRRDRENRFRRALHDDVPVRTDVKDLPGRERGAGGQRQREGAPPGRRHATAAPAALLGREHERVALVPGQIRVAPADVLASDHDNLTLARGNATLAGSGARLAGTIALLARSNALLAGTIEPPARSRRGPGRIGGNPVGNPAVAGPVKTARTIEPPARSRRGRGVWGAISGPPIKIESSVAPSARRAPART